MALLVKKLETDYGVIFENVYFKISSVSHVDTAHKLVFKGVFYINEEIRQENQLRYIDNMVFEDYFDWDDKTVNMYEQSYNHIKKSASILSAVPTNNTEDIDDLNIILNNEIYNKCKKYSIFVDAEDC